MEVNVRFRGGEARRTVGNVKKLWKNGGLEVEVMTLY